MTSEVLHLVCRRSAGTSGPTGRGPTTHRHQLFHKLQTSRSTAPCLLEALERCPCPSLLCPFAFSSGFYQGLRVLSPLLLGERAASDA